MKFGSLFAGIGGFEIGFERAGMKCVWQVEIDDYCNRVLEKHYPEVKRYGDIRTVGKRELEAVELICGGFPCQPYSVAGKRRGEKDDRNLWHEFLRIIRELRPRWIVAENVPGIVSMYLDTVLSDLEGEGYTCWTFNIPACAFDAPHRRERIFVVAHREHMGREARSVRASLQSKEQITEGQNIEQFCEVAAYATSTGLEGREYQERQSARQSFTPWTVEPNVGRVAYGIPNRVDRLKALGNAVVPQVAEFIGRVIMEIENEQSLP